jgi:type I restriction enzyme, S subunit
LPKEGTRLVLSDMVFVALDGEATEGQRTRLQPGDILISITADLGKIGFVRGEDFTEGYINQHIALVRINDANTNAEFIAYLLSHDPERKRLQQLNDAGAKAGLNLDSIRGFMVCVPSFREQERIAATLRIWDHAIDLTERLIAAKHERRTWLVQQLLTGKRRLPGFGEKWQVVDLSELFTNRVETNRPDLPLVAITGENGVVSRDDLERRDTSSEDKSSYLRICPGDIGYNTMRMWQGVCGLSQIEGIVSPAYTIVTPTDHVDGEFTALLFKSPAVVHLFHRHSQGLVNDTLNLKWRHFAEIRVPIPEKAEQRAIAAVFRSVDSEINLLRTQLDAIRKQKKGLMQQLLTGKIRVKA